MIYNSTNKATNPKSPTLILLLSEKSNKMELTAKSRIKKLFNLRCGKEKGKVTATQTNKIY